ncbi:MAG TPA: hypothetical protein VNE62_03400 [Actinomycetota bacterium]|nr:hypothetical protein [Actinomycetota bacterium]
MSVLKLGGGKPFTLFAPGGIGEKLDDRMSYLGRVKGTKIGFAYEHSGHFESVAKIRRQADRDAAEIRALAAEYKCKRAIGFSRGARGIVGALAEDPGAFERVALVIPPRGVTPGKWMPWLESLSGPEGRRSLSAEILVIADQVDAGHPVEVAEFWAAQLAARLEVHPPRTLYTDAEQMMIALANFFN